MYILSFDVGIKNLAYCLLKSDSDKNQIIDWDVADLCGDKKTCSINTCDQKASFLKWDTYLCTRHAKQFVREHPSFSLPSCVINKSMVSELSSVKLRKIAAQFDLANTKVPAEEQRTKLCEYIENHLMESVVVRSAKDIDLVEIGRALHHFFTQKAAEWKAKDCIPQVVLIENQISPIANRMKTIQGMLSQFFISASIFSKHNIEIKFVSSSNKLKDFTYESTTYEQRKKLGIEITKSRLCQDESNKQLWLEAFEKHTKKDDLADSYLQGLWYIGHSI